MTATARNGGPVGGPIGGLAGGPLVGLDIGGTSVHGVVLDGLDGSVVAEDKQPTRPGPDGIRALVPEMVTRLTDGAAPGGIGVGVPGVVVDGSVSNAVNVGVGDEPVDLAATVRSLTSGRVAVENDVKAAAVGAWQWLGTTEPLVSDFALVNVGTGLAAALVLDGRLRTGSAGVAGELGHVAFDREGPRCSCGRAGCLELYASGGGLRRSWSGTVAELFIASEAGDTRAKAVARDLVDGLAHAITLVTTLVDTQRVLVTGGLAADATLRRAVMECLEEDAHTAIGRAAQALHRLRWVPPEEPIGAVGAALLASDRRVPA